MRNLAIAALAISLPFASACSNGAENQTETRFEAITPGEAVRALGNEPFWSAEIAGDTLTYTTPEDMDGQSVAVTRFAGLGGLGFSGELDGKALDLAINEEPCSDTMSDRTYPFAVVLRIGDDTRQGCAWTDARPFDGLEMP